MRRFLIVPLFAWAVFLVLISNSLVGYGSAAIIAISIMPGAGKSLVGEMLATKGFKEVEMSASVKERMAKDGIEVNKDRMNEFKQEIATLTNREKLQGSLAEIAEKADVLIGVSSAGVFTKEMIQKMAEKPIVFALANPVPEISYKDAKDAGAFIVATGRSDAPNQVNNVLSFPNIMRGLLDSGAKHVDYDMLYEASKALAKCVGKELGVEHILPAPYSAKEMIDVLSSVASAVAASAIKSGNSRHSELDISAIKKNAAKIIKRGMKLEKVATKTQA